MRGFIAGVFLFPAFLLSIPAQTGSSTITGYIKDQSGSVIPGTKVKVVGEATGIDVDVTTNEQGLYRVTSLLPGRSFRRRF